MASAAEKRMGKDLERLDPLEGRAQDISPANIAELQREIARLPADDKRRDILTAELRNILADARAVNAGLDTGPKDDFSDLGVKRPELNDDFSDLGIKARPQRPAVTPLSEPTPEPDAGPALAAPGEFAVNPGGAVTGRTQPIAPRDTSRPTLPAPDPRTAGRIGVETLGSFLGGTAGARLGGATGMRVGEAAGAAAGSLLSETFDPTERPQETAAVAGIATGATGVAASALAGIGRKLAGKPHEAGKALADILAREGKVPPPGAVLESDFIRSAEAIGSAAFGTSELLKAARAQATEVTSDAVRNYQSGFQRFHDAAKKAFAQADPALAQSGLLFKGDPAVRDALVDVARESARVRGGTGVLDSHLQKILAWADGGPAPTFSFAETQAIYGSLFDKARALELRAARGEAGDKADHKFILAQADKVKKAFDKQVDFVVRDKRVPADTKDKLLLARASWNHWLEGKEIETMILKSTKDAVGDGPVTGSRLLGEIDKVVRRESEVGHAILSPNTKDSLRRYALALKAVEESGKVGQYGFIGRVGQLAGITGMAGGGMSAIGGAGAILFAAPHVLAYTFSNPTASALILRGLRLEPGSAAAARLGRELVTLYEKEGLIPPERVREAPAVEKALREREIPQGNPQPSPYRNPPMGGVRG